MLSGCVTKPTIVSMKWPEVPSDLQTTATDLTPLSDKDRTFTGLLLNANSNYSQYYQLKKKYEAWQEWYAAQKKIYEGSK